MAVISTRASGNWENEKLCGNTTPSGRGVFSDCISIIDINHRKTVLYFFYNIAQRNIKKEIFRVDIEVYQHGS